MVETQRSKGVLQFVLRPNRSLSWQGNLQVLGCVGIWLSVMGIGFAVQGAWPILPFLGLELGVLAYAFYRVSRQAAMQEVLRITSDCVELEVGTEWPRHYWRWDSQRVWVQIIEAKGVRRLATIELWDTSGQVVGIGCFLNADDRMQLIAALAATPLRLRRDCRQLELVV